MNQGFRCSKLSMAAISSFSAIKIIISKNSPRR